MDYVVSEVAILGKMRNTWKVLVGKLKERCCLENIGVHERIILVWIVNRMG
jgi:hypothetical protein